MVDIVAYERAICKYIASLDESILNSVSQLLTWNSEIQTQKIPVSTKIKCSYSFFYHCIVSLSLHLAGLLYWKENMCTVIDIYSIFCECNHQLETSLIGFLTSNHFDVVGTGPYSLFL